MSPDSVNARLSSLENKIEEMEHEIERLRAVNEIQNLMSRYEYYHQPITMERTIELFAQKAPDVSVTTPAGTYIGLEQISNLFKHILHEEPVGSMMEHHLTTPIIIIARDGKTAKGTWFTPGHETLPALDPHAYWAWGKYSVDFIKEDGKWKIWHQRGYITFRCRFDRSWVEPREPDPIAFREEEYPPDRRDAISTYYDPKGIRQMMPAPPDPYDTWEDHMLHRDKRDA